MEKDSAKRLGATGAAEVKGHPWFASVNWEQVLARQVPAPFKPVISDELDVSNFSEEFTMQAPVDSPAQPPHKHAHLFRVKPGSCYRAVFSIAYVVSVVCVCV